MHTHLSRDDRAVISDGVRRGVSMRTIGDRIGTDGSTVCREVRRNSDENGTYNVARAHKRARHRRQQSKTHTRTIENDPRLAHKIEAELDPLMPPETIAYGQGIHHQTIYDWIDRSRPDLKYRLPQRGRKRRRYGSYRAQKPGWQRNLRPIAERPETPVMWEGDTIEGTTRARVLTHVEKHSLYLDARVVSDGTADTIQTALKNTSFTGTITYDQGREFALWEMIERELDTAIYFADPHSPWQRPTNENTNGRLRRVFPKGFDFSTIQQRDLDKVVHKMNHTPRKSLSWRTPAEVYFNCCNSV